MTEPSRIDDLRRRVQKDPASIAFAQLAEELRRAGHYQESVETCRDGLARHPNYLSAHVTLGRALIQLQRLDEARPPLEWALRTAPQNLAAMRALAELHRRQNDAREALAYYEAALALAPNDPELERAIAEVSPQVQRADAVVAERATRTIAALERFLTAVHASRS